MKELEETLPPNWWGWIGFQEALPPNLEATEANRSTGRFSHCFASWWATYFLVTWSFIDIILLLGYLISLITLIRIWPFTTSSSTHWKSSSMFWCPWSNYVEEYIELQLRYWVCIVAIWSIHQFRLYTIGYRDPSYIHIRSSTRDYGRVSYK